MNHCLLFNCHTLWSQRPSGSYRIATLMREQGWDAEVLDWASCFHLEELQEFAKERITDKTVFLGFSCFFCYWDDNLEAFAAWVKKEYPHVKLIMGMMGKPSVESKSIDYYVYGFGENALLAIVASLTGNTPGTGIRFDPSYLAVNKKVVNANDYYPSFPLKSLLIKYEDRDYIDSNEWLGIEFARGCMFECLYCNFPVLGVKGDYTRDSADFVYQVKDAYERFGVTNYYVSDETFNDRTDKIIKFADAVDELNFRPNFSGFVRGDLMVSRKQDWQHMSRLGFIGQFYGIESFNHKTLKTVGKGMHPDKLKDGLLEIKDYFRNTDRKLYRGTAAFIAGLPYETKESLHDTKEWILKNWYDENYDMTPLEITKNEMIDKHSKLSKDWAKWGYRDKNQSVASIKNEWVSVMHTIDALNWENDDMDYDYVKKFCSDMYQDPRSQQMGLHNYWLNWGQVTPETTIEEVLSTRNNSPLNTLAMRFAEKLRTYKSKKLHTPIESLRPIKLAPFNGTYKNQNPWGFTYDESPKN